MSSALAFYRVGGVVLAILGLPLVFRLVPQNPIFGARLREAFASSANWYAINAYAGKLLSGFGLALFGVSFPLAHLLATATRGTRALLLLLPTLALLALARRIRRFVRQYHR